MLPAMSLGMFESMEDAGIETLAELTAVQLARLAGWVRSHGYTVVVLAGALWVSFDDSATVRTVDELAAWMGY